MKKLLIILSLFSLPVLADESSFKNLNEYFEYLPNSYQEKKLVISNLKQLSKNYLHLIYMTYPSNS